MAKAALDALSTTSPNGFVLFVENENTDTAGHYNDAAGVMRALWAFNDAVKVALAEDAEDLAAFDQRRSERSISFESLVRDLRKRGRI